MNRRGPNGELLVLDDKRNFESTRPQNGDLLQFDNKAGNVEGSRGLKGVTDVKRNYQTS